MNTWTCFRSWRQSVSFSILWSWMRNLNFFYSMSLYGECRFEFCRVRKRDSMHTIDNRSRPKFATFLSHSFSHILRKFMRQFSHMRTIKETFVFFLKTSLLNCKFTKGFNSNKAKKILKMKRKNSFSMKQIRWNTLWFTDHLPISKNSMQ